jgi:hypothetical protein
VSKSSVVAVVWLLLIPFLSPHSFVFAPQSTAVPQLVEQQPSKKKLSFDERWTTSLWAVTTTGIMSDITDANSLATSRGYAAELGLLMLYMPIAVCIFKTRRVPMGQPYQHVGSNWRCIRTCSDIYCLPKGYPLSRYIETLTITVEAAVILGLVG